VDIDTYKPTATIYWELQPEARERGIKGIGIVINRVTCDVEWNVDSEGYTDEEKLILLNYGSRDSQLNFEGNIELDSKTLFDDKDWDISHELEFASDGAIMPEEVEIDFETMKITVL